MLGKIVEWIKGIFRKEEKINKIYTLAEYLDLVSEYTDSTILKEKSNKNKFTGGECKTRVIDNKHVKFSIQMYFINDQSERSLKTSERILLIDNFDDKSRNILSEGEKRFEIMVPTGDR